MSLKTQIKAAIKAIKDRMDLTIEQMAYPPASTPDGPQGLFDYFQTEDSQKKKIEWEGDSYCGCLVLFHPNNKITYRTNVNGDTKKGIPALEYYSILAKVIGRNTYCLNHQRLNSIYLSKESFIPFICKNAPKESTTPIRVQRKRVKGYKLPPNTVCVNRGTKWGNPFKVSFFDKKWIVTHGVIGKPDVLWDDVTNGYDTKDEAIIIAIELYERYIINKIKTKQLDITDLYGKNLACFCSLKAKCHVDVLLKLANK